MNRGSVEGIFWLGACYGVIAALSPEQRAAFDEWDCSRPSSVASSDWPGFELYIGKPPTLHDARRPVYAGVKLPIPPDIRWAIWERDGFRCKRCGTRRNLSIDHIIPESKGGPLDTGNLQTLCRACNSSKGAR